MGPGQSYGINTPEPVGRYLSCRGVGLGASCRTLGMAGATGCGLVRAGPAPVPLDAQHSQRDPFFIWWALGRTRS